MGMTEGDFEGRTMCPLRGVCIIILFYCKKKKEKHKFLKSESFIGELDALDFLYHS